MASNITPGDWYVPMNLQGDEAEANGVIVVCGRGETAAVIADCRNDYLPASEVRANARAIAAVPRMAMALAMAEAVIGDLPQTPARKNVHAAVVRALTLAGEIRGRPE